MNSSVILMVLVTTQIIAESFPVSSSGHLYLVDRLAQVFGFQYLPHIPEAFEHFLHGPTIIVLVLYFYRSWYSLLRLLLTSWMRVIKNGYWSYSQQCLQRLFYTVVGIVAIADGMTVLFYVLLKKRLHDGVVGDGMVLLGFILTMLLLLSLRWVHSVVVRYVPLRSLSFGEHSPRTGRNTPFTLPVRHSYQSVGGSAEQREVYRRATFLGLAQSIALVLPGFSRFASTYVVARWLGVPHRRAFQLSFLILFPLIIAGFFVNGVGGMMAQSLLCEIMTLPMLATLAGSTIISYYAFKLSDWMGMREKLWLFGVYMLVPVCVMTVLYLKK